MSISISGYKIGDELHKGHRSIIYHAVREEGKLPVIIKTLRTAYPTHRDISRIKHEYEIIKNLNIQGVAHAYGLKKHDNNFVLILEYIKGKTLKDFIKSNTIEIKDFLLIAAHITAILGDIHKENVIHKDMNPRNIIIDPETFEAKIIDFGLSTLLQREEHGDVSPGSPDGALAYISPEQTGRMNRAIDYRTDFYSLGVTFYEMLTGSLPFQSTDSMELVHCHIARDIEPPDKVCKDIPFVVSLMVMKLLSKNAEERYQSAYGLKSDLDECLRQLSENGKIEDLTAGRHDINERFNISQKLYGRESDVETLLRGFERACKGNPSILLVSGYSGVGKSALVNEVHKPIVKQNGYFITGKFDQFKRNIPYSALGQAFRGLVRQLLTESEESVKGWKKKLLDALGPNAQVITDLIPEVENIISKPPPAPQLGPQETRNRFNMVFQQFIDVFTREEHPLVLFLDDLQWVDLASLNMLKVLMTEAENKHLFMIGAYRDNEVEEHHPLMLALDEMQKAGIAVNKMSLSPLNTVHINQLISDTLHRNHEGVIPLSELVMDKTDGNPFFVKQFLQALYEEGLIEFNYSDGNWQWDLDHIKKMNITDNVVELMAGKIRRLSDNIGSTLQLAACVGIRFDLKTLSVVNEMSYEETVLNIREGVIEGLVVPIDDSYIYLGAREQGLGVRNKKGDQNEIISGTGLYKEGGDEDSFSKDPANREDVQRINKKSIQKIKSPFSTTDPWSPNPQFKFLHDRIQQAAYSLISKERRTLLHQKMGRLILKNCTQEEIEEKIFDIVNHLNVGSELITDREEREELARLNHRASTKASGSVAYDDALQYSMVGIGLLGENRWSGQYELTLSLHVEGAEAAYLSGNYQKVEELAGEVLEHAESVLDRVKAYETRILVLIAQDMMEEARVMVLYVLRQLGILLPERPGMFHILYGMYKAKWTLRGKTMEELKNLPQMTDRHKLAAMRIIVNSSAALYLTASKHLLILVYRMTIFSTKYGNSPFSPMIYVIYGNLLCNIEGRPDDGYRFGILSLDLVERPQFRQLTAKTSLIFNAYIRHWKAHLKDSIKPLLDGYEVGVETGDFDYACGCAVLNSFFLLNTGLELKTLEDKMANYQKAAKKLKQPRSLTFLILPQQVALNLIGKSTDPSRLVGEIFNEDKMIPFYIDNNNNAYLGITYVYKLMLSYLFGNYRQALDNALTSGKYHEAMFGHHEIPIRNLYYSLTLLILYPESKNSEQKQYVKRVRANQKQMKKWANNAPMNHLHKYYLVEAELARVRGKDAWAMDLYDKSVSLARENEYVNEEALANEVAARFYLSRGREKSAMGYINEARYCYYRWGAYAKVKDMEERYPQLLRKEFLERELSAALSTSSTISSNMTSTALDLKTLTKSSQAISSEFILEKLLSKFMKIVMENAGAKRGYLLMEESGQLMIEVESELGKESACTQRSVSLKSDVHGSILPISIIQYAQRTHENVILDEAAHNGMFTTDPYMINAHPESILCMPIVNQGRVMGILYLENKVTKWVFTAQKMEFLKILSSQMAISIENARLYKEFVSYQQQLKSLASSLSLAEERERRRIAENLHDCIGQNLVVIKMRLGALQGLKFSNGVTSILKETKDLIGQTIQDLRSMTFELSPPILYAFGFEPAIEWLIEQFQKQHNIVIDFVRDEQDKPLDDDMRALLFKATRELFFNIVKHAKAHLITITIRRVDSSLKIDIIDDGVGFDSQNISLSMTNTGGFGLFNIRERLEHLGGHMRIKSKPGHGTQVTMDVPLKYENKGAMDLGKNVSKQTKSDRS